MIRNTTKVILALAAFAAFAPAAEAADLAATPVWTGLYGGVNVGYGFGSGGRTAGGQTYYENTTHDSQDVEWYGTGGPSWNRSSDLDGVLGGAQIGYNVQISPSVVVGLETDFQGSALSDKSTSTDATAIPLYPANVPGSPNYWPVTATASVNQHVDWFGTVRGRLGFTTMDNALLIYGTGGLAYGSVKQDFSYSGGFLPVVQQAFAGSHWAGSVSNSETKLGWTVGGGLEWVPDFMTNWSIKVEYLYTDLGSVTSHLSTPAYKNDTNAGGRVVEASNKTDASWHTVRLGLNYHF